MSCSQRLPDTCDQLDLLLHDENWCRNYIISTRWPDGFICVQCGRNNILLSEPNVNTCPYCQNRLSITAGTLLHGTKKDISQWLRAIWAMCNSRGKLTIRDLQEELKIQNYQTARNWMKKLHHSRKIVTNQKCAGTVEVENCKLFIRKEKIECHIFAALEIHPKNYTTGRIRMMYFRDLSRGSLRQFLHHCVHKSSTLLLPEREPYLLDQSDRYLNIIESPLLNLWGVRKSITSFIGSHLNHSSIVFSLKRLESLRDEFCFLENRNLFPDRLAVFEDMVAAMVDSPPLSSASSSTAQRSGDSFP